MSKTYSAGIVTAYGAAKRAGYQGTYEDFCRQQAGYAESAATVEQAKNTAVSAASTATTKAMEATTAATAAQTAKTQTEAAASQALTDISTAESGAISAVQTEGATQTANATAQAQAAATSATTASTKASEASASATTATTKATEAAASATSAASSASAAQGVLESIPEDYSDLSEDVDQLKADLGDNINDLKSIIGQWYFTRNISGSRYPYLQINEFGSRVYFKLIEPLECTSLSVYGSNDNWQTQTALHSQFVALEGYSCYVDIPSSYTALRFVANMPSTYTGNISAIIHTVDNYSISQYVLDLSNDTNRIETSLVESLYSIGDAMTGTNYNGFYLNSAPYQGISSISNTSFNLRKYTVEKNKKYYLVGKNISLMAALPLAAFGTEEVVAKNNYIEKILDGQATGTDYFTSYIPDVDGYIYVAWITNKAELQLYDSQLVSDVIDEILTDSTNIKKNIKIQLFGDSITDNQWGDRATWANYITEMMPNYNVTIVNDAVGGSGIGHGASKGTTDSHQDDEYNYVHDLVTDGQTLQTDSNAVVILVGTNNWTSGAPLGDMSSTGAGTIYGALKGIIEYISQNSEAIIFICTIPQRYNSADQSRPTNEYGEPLNSTGISLSEYCVPFEKVSAFYGVPCVHLNTSLGWNRINITNFCGDGLHPNAKGDVMLAKYICSEIMKHI